jgi:hypothetical protein
MKFKSIDKIIKITLATLMLLCLLKMPYGFYEFVRFIALVGFGVLAYKVHEKEDKTTLIIFITLALLFQPFFKIALGRLIWNIVDIITAIYLLASLIKPSKTNRDL